MKKKYKNIKEEISRIKFLITENYLLNEQPLGLGSLKKFPWERLNKIIGNTPNPKLKYFFKNDVGDDIIKSQDDFLKALKSVNKEIFQKELGFTDEQFDILIGLMEDPDKFPIYDFVTKKTVINQLPKGNIRNIITSEWYYDLPHEYQVKFTDDINKSQNIQSKKITAATDIPARTFNSSDEMIINISTLDLAGLNNKVILGSDENMKELSEKVVNECKNNEIAAEIITNVSDAQQNQIDLLKIERLKEVAIQNSLKYDNINDKKTYIDAQKKINRLDQKIKEIEAKPEGEYKWRFVAKSKEALAFLSNPKNIGKLAIWLVDNNYARELDPTFRLWQGSTVKELGTVPKIVRRTTFRIIWLTINVGLIAPTIYSIPGAYRKTSEDPTSTDSGVRYGFNFGTNLVITYIDNLSKMLGLDKEGMKDALKGILCTTLKEISEKLNIPTDCGKIEKKIKDEVKLLFETKINELDTMDCSLFFDGKGDFIKHEMVTEKIGVEITNIINENIEPIKKLIPSDSYIKYFITDKKMEKLLGEFSANDETKQYLQKLADAHDKQKTRCENFNPKKQGAKSEVKDEDFKQTKKVEVQIEPESNDSGLDDEGL
jgi:hypothetical protein